MSETTIPDYVFWYKASAVNKEGATPKSVAKFAKTSEFRAKQVSFLNDEEFAVFIGSKGFQKQTGVYARPATKAEIADSGKFEPIRDAIENVRKAEKAFRAERDVQRSAIRDWAIDNCTDAEDFSQLVKDVPTYTYTIYNLIFCDHTLNEEKKFSKAQIKAWLEEVNTRRGALTKALVPLPEAEFIAAFSYTPADKSQDATTAMNELIKANAKRLDDKKSETKLEEADSE